MRGFPRVGFLIVPRMWYPSSGAECRLREPARRNAKTARLAGVAQVWIGRVTDTFLCLPPLLIGSKQKAKTRRVYPSHDAPIAARAGATPLGRRYRYDARCRHDRRRVARAVVVGPVVARTRAGRFVRRATGWRSFSAGVWARAEGSYRAGDDPVRTGRETGKIIAGGRPQRARATCGDSPRSAKCFPDRPPSSGGTRCATIRRRKFK